MESLLGLESKAAVEGWLAECEALRGSRFQGTCAARWGRNDFAFKCRTCQTDGSCAVCVDCFFRGNRHAGHEAALIMAGVGCCDCGDHSSWAPAGCCDLHAGIDSDEVYAQGIALERAGHGPAHAGISDELDAALRRHVAQVGQELSAAWATPREARADQLRLVARLDELVTFVAKSFYVRSLVETHLFTDALLTQVLSAPSASPKVQEKVVDLLIALIPMIGFKKRCGRIALVCMPQAHAALEPTAAVLAYVELCHNIAVQLFTVNIIADDALENNLITPALEAFVRAEPEPIHFLSHEQLSHARFIAYYLSYLFGAATPARLWRFVLHNAAFFDFMQLYSRTDLQRRATTHVEYESHTFAVAFRWMFLVFGELDQLFDYAQTQLCPGEAKPEVVAQLSDLLQRTIGRYTQPPPPGVTFHLADLRIAFRLMPLDWLLHELRSNSRAAQHLVDVLPRDQLRHAVEQITSTLYHTLAIANNFWRRNGETLVSQMLNYTLRPTFMRVDTMVVWILMALYGHQKAEPLGPLVAMCLEGPLEQCTESSLGQDDFVADVHRRGLACLTQWTLEAREESAQKAVGHTTETEPLMRMVLLWQILALLSEWGVRNVELFAASPYPGKRDQRPLPAEFDSRLREVHAAEYVDSLISHDPTKGKLKWDLSYPVPDSVVEEYSTSANGNRQVSSRGLPFVTRTTIQRYYQESSDIESFLSELGDRAQVVGPPWELLAPNADDVASWAGKTLFFSTLVHENLTTMTEQLLHALKEFQPLSVDQLKTTEEDKVEVGDWESNQKEELLMAVCTCICNLLVPYWTEVRCESAGSIRRLLLGFSSEDKILRRALAVTVHRLAKVIDVDSEEQAGGAGDDRAKLAATKQQQLMAQFRERQKQLLDEFYELSDSEGADDDVDDYANVPNKVLAKLRETRSREDRQRLEVFSKGTHICVVCQQGPREDDCLHVFLYLELANLLPRMLHDPVVGDVPLCGTALSIYDLPVKSVTAVSCGHLVHSQCIHIMHKYVNCPSCRAKCNYLLPLMPLWNMFNEDQVEFPFEWRRSNEAQPPSVTYKLRFSKETVQYRVEEGDVTLLRGHGNGVTVREAGPIFLARRALEGVAYDNFIREQITNGVFIRDEIAEEVAAMRDAQARNNNNNNGGWRRDRVERIEIIDGFGIVRATPTHSDDDADEDEATDEAMGVYAPLAVLNMVNQIAPYRPETLSSHEDDDDDDASATIQDTLAALDEQQSTSESSSTEAERTENVVLGPEVRVLDMFALPDDNGLRMVHEINACLNTQWDLNGDGWKWMTARCLTPMFYVTYLEVLRTARHAPLRILDVHTGSTFVLFAHLLRNLCLTQPADCPYAAFDSDEEVWRWPSPMHINHTQTFLHSLLMHLQNGRPLSDIWKLIQLQSVMVVLSTLYNLVLQEVKRKTINGASSYLLLLGKDMERFFFGGYQASLCARHRHTETALRNLEWAGLKTRAEMEECSPKRARRQADNADKLLSRRMANMFLALPHWSESECPREVLESLAGSEPEPDALGLENLIEFSQPLDRDTAEVADVMADYNRNRPTVEIWSCVSESFVPKSRGHLEQVLDGIEAHLGVRVKLDKTGMEKVVAATVCDFLMFVFTALSGVFKLSDSSFINKLAYPSESAEMQAGMLMEEVFPELRRLAGDFSVNSFLESVSDYACFDKALRLLWSNREASDVYPLPRLHFVSSGLEGLFMSPIQRMYKFGPPLPPTFFDVIKLNIKRRCVVCQKTLGSAKVCLLCGMFMCCNFHLRHHTSHCFGCSTPLYTPMTGTMYLTSMRWIHSFDAHYKSLYNHPDDKLTQADLDHATLSTVYTQVLLGSISRWL